MRAWQEQRRQRTRSTRWRAAAARILDALADGERPVNDLVHALGMAQPQVSKHLRVLREVGAVDVRDEGRQRLYRLNGHALKPIHDWVKNYERPWSERFVQLDAVLEDLNRRSKEMAMTSSGSAKVTLRRTIRSSSRASSTRRGSWSSRRGPRPSWSSAGGAASAAGHERRDRPARRGMWRYVMEANGGIRGRLPRRVPRDRPERADRVHRGLRGHARGRGASTRSRSPRWMGARRSTMLVQHTSKEDRDGHINSGMEGGMQESMDPSSRSRSRFARPSDPVTQ